MKERPILFSGEMVRAVLDGRKWQTRRVVKPQPHEVVDADAILAGFLDKVPIDVGWEYVSRNCPYGRPGDVLWCKETWATRPDLDHLKPRDIPEGSKIYRVADGELGLANCDRLRPSIFMRRWMSRITLEVTDVRVERVQDISVADAIAEGIDPVPCDHAAMMPGYGCTDCMGTGVAEDPRVEFMHLWGSINAKRGYPWESNPWVWAVSFSVVEARQ